jgi:hypothetical protein
LFQTQRKHDEIKILISNFANSPKIVINIFSVFSHILHENHYFWFYANYFIFFKKFRKIIHQTLKYTAVISVISPVGCSLMEPQMKYALYCSYKCPLFNENVNTLIPLLVQYLSDIKIVNFRRSKVAAAADQH